MSRLVIVAVVLVSAAFAVRYPRPMESFAASERARVRAHLDNAEREVRAANVAGLTAVQRAARARALDRLHEYWVRGIFPRNTDFPGQQVPYFIDRSGTRCAMAYLIEQAGGRDLAARVAATNNNARIPELSNDPQLAAWLNRNGITLAEAARIQPAYGCCPPGALCISPLQKPCGLTSSSASTGYKTATALSVGADALAVALNSLPSGLSRRLTGGLGIAIGTVGIGIGFENFDASGAKRTLGFVNAGVGAVSIAFGMHGLSRGPKTASRLSIAPWLDPRGGTGIRGHVGF